MQMFEVEVQSKLHEYYVVEATSRDAAKERVLSGELDPDNFIHGEIVDFYIDEVKR